MTDVRLSDELSRAFGQVTPEELTLLRAQLTQLPPDPRAVEIGSGAGTSASCLLEERPDLRLHTIDLRGTQNVRARLTSAGLDRGMVHYHDCDSLEALARVPDSVPLDLLLVDGDHRAETVRAELAAWLPRLRPGGMLLIHDYGRANAMWSGVKDAADPYLVGWKRRAHRNSLACFIKPLEDIGD